MNILIHFINASLILWLLIEIQSARGATGGARTLVPLAAATLWLLWPIHASSVLYVVQRMTLLSASCVFFGLAIYVRASTTAALAGGLLKAHGLFAVALGAGIGLGVLCKENAIVYPLLALILRATLLAQLPPQPRIWLAALWLPVIGLIIYLAFSPGAFDGYQIRDFNALERLMTQTRVLWMYVFQIIAPSPSSLRFLYDNYAVSRSLLNPAITAAATLSIFAVAVAAWRLRRRYPSFAFAVLFFLGSHALESTILPLELVFEHRNYMGSLAVAYALAVGWWHWIAAAGAGKARLARLLGGAYLAAICATTFSLTTLWGNPLQQKQLWVLQNADSPRAHMDLAGQFLLEGYADAGAQTLEAGSARFPDDMGFPIARAELACYYPDLRPPSLESVARSLATGTHGFLSATIYLDRIAVAIADGECDTYSVSEALDLVAAAQANTAFSSRARDLVVLKGSLHSVSGNTSEARAALDQAITMNPSPSLLLQAATWEIGNGNFAAARGHLDRLSSLRQTAPLKYLAIRSDLEKLQELVAASE